MAGSGIGLFRYVPSTYIIHGITDWPGTDLVLDGQSERWRQSLCVQQAAIQRIRWVLTIAVHVATGDEHRGGDGVTLQQGSGMPQVVCKAVVKGHNDSLARDTPFHQSLREIGQAHRSIVLPQVLQLFGKVGRGDTVQLRIRFKVRDPMVEQNQRTALKLVPETAQSPA